MRKHILITGTPGIGKTTLIQKIAEELRSYRPAGFYTEEICERGVRKGFELIGLNGKRSMLSHVDIESPQRVSKYGVDVKGFDTFLDELSLSASGIRLIIIDEIGKMECFSEKFRMLIQDILGSDTILVATVALKGSGMIAEVKNRTDSELIEVTYDNRDSLKGEIIQKIKDMI